MSDQRAGTAAPGARRPADSLETDEERAPGGLACGCAGPAPEADEKRDDPVLVRMRRSEHDELRAAAGRSGMGVATYVRAAALEKARGR